MDPVELYHCAGSNYVLDGHHRIAVARALGQPSVWALVTEVRLTSQALPARQQGSPDPLSRGTHPSVDWCVDWPPGILSTASAVCALAGGMSAAHASVAPERTYGKEKVYGSIP
jgi:hypothetical protein